VNIVSDSCHSSRRTAFVRTYSTLDKPQSILDIVDLRPRRAGLPLGSSLLFLLCHRCLASHLSAVRPRLFFLRPVCLRLSPLLWNACLQATSLCGQVWNCGRTHSHVACLSASPRARLGTRASANSQGLWKTRVASLRRSFLRGAVLPRRRAVSPSLTPTLHYATTPLSSCLLPLRTPHALLGTFVSLCRTPPPILHIFLALLPLPHLTRCLLCCVLFTGILMPRVASPHCMGILIAFARRLALFAISEFCTSPEG